MLHLDDPRIRALALTGEFGLEKEGLRIDREGFLAATPHPFPDNPTIIRDFCENQTEINTPVAHSAREAVATLAGSVAEIERTLAHLPEREFLWPFSNPPYICSERDIPVAHFEGPGAAEKNAYRSYLSDRYGRYKMTFSGIHVNYSFSETLLRASWERAGSVPGDETAFRAYKDALYLHLAEQLVAYGWIFVAATAASPLLDCSFAEKGVYGTDMFWGLASVRCSELGYWNFFAPVLDYTGVDAYANSIQAYVDQGFISAPSELYYPIRLKPAGANTLDGLRGRGVNHIELRMFDLNPFEPAAIDERDLAFAQLVLVWLAATPGVPLTASDQVQAVQNFKNAAHYDLKTVKVALPGRGVRSVAQAAHDVIDELRRFYADFDGAGDGMREDIRSVLDFEAEKFEDVEKRYAWKVRRQFSGGFVQKGLALARRRQEAALHPRE